MARAAARSPARGCCCEWQASKDLTLYEEKAPGNLIYDKSAKRYKAADDFKPVFMLPNASTYLAHLRETNGGASGVTEAWLASAPAHDALPIPHRRVEAGVLRDVLKAVREGHSIEVFYQSMSANKHTPEWRRISPHALGNDGLRWHICGKSSSVGTSIPIERSLAASSTSVASQHWSTTTSWTEL